MLREIANDIWSVDGSDVVFAGAAMHTRMTVVRLDSGRLWVHSPIELTAAVRDVVNDLGGDVSALIAPNKFHHLFIGQWMEEFPHAHVYAESELKHKIPSLAIAEEITNASPELYGAEIDQVVFGGNRMFSEAVFFHKASRTLILTDLMINLRTENVKLLPRLFLKFEGVVFPNGGIPRLYRWFTRDKSQAREALAVITKWSPERLVFCHGEPFEDAAHDVIAREFSWLLQER